MKKSLKKTKIGIVVTLVALIVIGMYTNMASAVNLYWNFTDGRIPSWTALYNNADMVIESEDNGNNYLRLSYNGEAHRNREYYDVKVASITNGSGILQADYDIMYSNNDTEKDGDIQFKQRLGPGSNETTMVARLGKNNGYFRSHNESGEFTAIKDLSNETLEVQPGRWYSVKLVVDLDKGKQSVLIFDRDSQELLSYSEYSNTIDNNKKINMITFSSGTDMCLDNVRIYNTTCENGYIYGSPYISSATKNKYVLLGQNSDGKFTAMPEGSTEWSLETEREGVSVDSDTSRIIVGSKPEPGPVVLKAEKITDSDTITTKYIVNVSK